MKRKRKGQEEIPPPPGLPDYLGKGMRILFIGYNPGLRSAELGHHYAGRGNSFFPLLASAGLIDRPLTHAKEKWFEMLRDTTRSDQGKIAEDQP